MAEAAATVVSKRQDGGFITWVVNIERPHQSLSDARVARIQADAWAEVMRRTGSDDAALAELQQAIISVAGRGGFRPLIDLELGDFALAAAPIAQAKQAAM